MAKVPDREPFAIPSYAIATAKCRYCGAPVLWVVPYGGPHILVDAVGPYRGRRHARRCARMRAAVFLRRPRESAVPFGARTSATNETTGEAGSPERWKGLHSDVRSEFAPFGRLDATEPVARGRDIALPAEVGEAA